VKRREQQLYAGVGRKTLTDFTDTWIYLITGQLKCQSTGALDKNVKPRVILTVCTGEKRGNLS
jgi:hypothetical protein